MNDRIHDIAVARGQSWRRFAARTALVMVASLAAWPAVADDSSGIKRLPPVAPAVAPGLLPASAANALSVENGIDASAPQSQRASFLQESTARGEASQVQRVSHEAPAFDYEADANPFQFTAQE